jgi:hypothetical protein
VRRELCPRGRDDALTRFLFGRSHDVRVVQVIQTNSFVCIFGRSLLSSAEDRSDFFGRCGSCGIECKGAST